MPNDFNGLPLHPLIVHATVVVIPLAAVMVVLAALSSRFRTWAGPLPLATSLVGLILVPLSTSTGETLEKHTPASALLERHTELADGLLPWMIALFVVSLAAYAIHRRTQQGHSFQKMVTAAVAILAIAGAVGTTVQVARIGHAGAKSAWEDTHMSSTTRPTE